MPVPQPLQQNLPRRYNVEWTRGGLVNTTPVGIHIATSQDIVGPPTAPILAGSDTVGFSGVMSGSLAVNATQNLAIPISFSGIPSMAAPPGYSLVAQPSVNVTTSISGINISSASLVVTATVPGVGQISGPVFPAGSYSGFGGYVYLTLTNSSGATINPGTISGTAVLQLWIYNKDLAAKSNVQLPGGGGAPGSISNPPGGSPNPPPNPPGTKSPPPGGYGGPTRY